MTGTDSKQAQRKAVMAVLAQSDRAEISVRLDAIDLPDHENLREPENGLVMAGTAQPSTSAKPRCRGRRCGFRPARSDSAIRSAATGKRRG